MEDDTILKLHILHIGNTFILNLAGRHIYTSF